MPAGGASAPTSGPRGGRVHLKSGFQCKFQEFVSRYTFPISLLLRAKSGVEKLFIFFHWERRGRVPEGRKARSGPTPGDVPRRRAGRRLRSNSLPAVGRTPTTAAAAAATALPLETIGAIHGLRAIRLEGHLAALPAGRTGGSEHFAGAAAAATAAAEPTLRFARSAAIGATARGVGEPTLRVEFLLTGCEYEAGAAIAAT